MVRPSAATVFLTTAAATAAVALGACGSGADVPSSATSTSTTAAGTWDPYSGKTLAPGETSTASASIEAAAKEKADAAAKAKAELDAKLKAEAEAAAKAKAAADAVAQAALRDRTKYRALSSRDWSLLAKTPESHIGEKVKVYGNVTQFDAATGVDTFRANTDGVRHTQSYEYDTNTLVTAGAADLSNVVEHDLVTMYVEVTGSNSYETTLGGTTTIPTLKVHVIEVAGSTK